MNERMKDNMKRIIFDLSISLGIAALIIFSVVLCKYLLDAQESEKMQADIYIQENSKYTESICNTLYYITDDTQRSITKIRLNSTIYTKTHGSGTVVGGAISGNKGYGVGQVGTGVYSGSGRTESITDYNLLLTIKNPSGKIGYIDTNTSTVIFEVRSDISSSYVVRAKYKTEYGGYKDVYIAYLTEEDYKKDEESIEMGIVKSDEELLLLTDDNA